MVLLLTHSYPFGALIKTSVRTQVRNLEALNGFLWNFVCVTCEKTVDKLKFSFILALLTSTLDKEKPTCMSEVCRT
jgi:hypothetical protein